MTDQQRLESFLLSLERALSKQTSELRSRIVSQTRTSIDESLARGLSMSGALDGVGSVEHICINAGIKPASPPRTFRKILLIASMTFATFFFLFAIGISWMFAKVWRGWSDGDWVFQMNSKDSISDSYEGEMDQFLLGGRILPRSEEEVLIEDKRDVKAYQIKSFKVLFPNGKMRVSWNESDSLGWTCKVIGPLREGSSEIQNGQLVLNLEQAFGVKCDVKIPRGVDVTVVGINGDIQVIKPADNVDIQLTNGRVEIDERSNVLKNFSLSAKNGRVHSFESSQDPMAKKIKVTIANGMIGRLESE